MSRFGHLDILFELTELSRELMTDIRQQLDYYRASVYKHETASQIKRKIEQLRLLAGLVGDELVQEPFHDHDAMLEAGAIHYIPGECSFSARTTQLLRSLDEQLTQLANRHSGQHQTDGDRSLARNVQKHRSQLLALCRHGSRQWAFFQTL